MENWEQTVDPSSLFTGSYYILFSTFAQVVRRQYLTTSKFMLHPKRLIFFSYFMRTAELLQSTSVVITA